MGQKVNPVGIRLGIVKNWSSVWFADKKTYADNLLADLKVREFFYNNQKLADAAVSDITIERPAKNAKITLNTARPGVIIGQKGKSAEGLRDEVSKIMGVPVHINIKEIRKPELDAKLVADTVAKQLEQRVMFRRAMKRAITSAMRSGALGVKICVSGRVGGAEIARSEWYREGRVPLHTFRADIDYAISEALTTYGIIGVKVWIFKGEIIGKKQQAQQETPEEAAAES